MEEAAEAIGFHRNYVPLICLVGGLMGLAAMFLMETWVSVFAYPLNIAGRPLFSWPAFIIPAYEWTILWAGLSAAFGMLAMCGLPAPSITRSSTLPISVTGQRRTNFFFVWRRTIPSSRLVESRSFLESFGPVSVVEVEY